MFGLLNINKPAGITSRDVVNRVQRIVRPLKAGRPVKVGHAGTLDPLADGVLVVGVGQATRLVQYVQRMPKHYIGSFLLGRQSDTEDVEGQVELLSDPVKPSREQIEEILPRFVGVIQQRPPAFSALKVGGRRAYDLARRGEKVELQPREITIHSLKLVAYEYPQMRLDIHCGSGTYVRSLGRDVAESLGTAAVMSALTRHAIGEYCLTDACELDQLTAESIPNYLTPAAIAVSGLPSMSLTDHERGQIVDGRFIENRCQLRGEIAAFDSGGALRAILKRRGPDKLKPHRVFLPS